MKDLLVAQFWTLDLEYTVEFWTTVYNVSTYSVCCCHSYLGRGVPREGAIYQTLLCKMCRYTCLATYMISRPDTQLLSLLKALTD